ncbi:hypothetical protein V1278_000233 [Bradyrhizobium sp. AZCC 1577]
MSIAGVPTVPIDTFNLERRPLRSLDPDNQREPAPAMQQ